MNHNHSSNEDLWEEFNNPETSLLRRVQLLWEFGCREASKYFDEDPMKYWTPGLELARENQFKTEWVKFCDDMARWHVVKTTQYLTAIEFLDEGLGLIGEFSMDSEERVLQAHMTWGKAVALENLGRIDEALYCYNTGSAMYSDLSNSYGANILKKAATFCHIELGQYEQAEANIPALRDYFQESNNLDNVAYLDSLQAYVLLSRNQEDEALQLLLEAKSVMKQLNTIDPEFLCRLAYGYYRNLEYSTAEKIYREAAALAINGKPDDFIYAVKANYGLADTLEAKGKKKEAAEARFDAENIESRRAVNLVPKAIKSFREIEKLRNSGDYQLAIQLGTEVVAEQADAGNISLHLRAECENLFTLFLTKKYDEVLNLWARLPQKAIDTDDNLALRVKNMVVHSLFRCNRVDEARELCYQVVADIRLQSNRQEMAYAYENLAEIEPDPELRKKHQSVAIESNLEANNPTRALQITRKFREEY